MGGFSDFCSRLPTFSPCPYILPPRISISSNPSHPSGALQLDNFKPLFYNNNRILIKILSKMKQSLVKTILVKTFSKGSLRSVFDQLQRGILLFLCLIITSTCSSGMESNAQQDPHKHHQKIQPESALCLHLRLINSADGRLLFDKILQSKGCQCMTSQSQKAHSDGYQMQKIIESCDLPKESFTEIIKISSDQCFFQCCKCRVSNIILGLKALETHMPNDMPTESERDQDPETERLFCRWMKDFVHTVKKFKKSSLDETQRTIFDKEIYTFLQKIETNHAFKKNKLNKKIEPNNFISQLKKLLMSKK
jgi:hypothetical protein